MPFLKMKMPVLAAILAAVFVWCLPAAAQETTAERGKLLLKLWDVPDPRSSAAPDLANLAVISAFNRKYPNVLLQSFSGIRVGSMGEDSQTLMAIAGRMAPDVLHVNFRQSDTYISQGFLYPLDEYIAGMPEEVWEGRVPAPVVPVAYRIGPEGEKHWYALPVSISVRALMYRKDLFQEVGLDPNRPPQTWEEMEAYAERLTRPDKGTYGLLFTMGRWASWDWMTFLWSAGGDAVELNDKGEWEAVFNSEAAVTAVLFYVDLNTKKWPDSSGKENRGYVYRDTGGYYKWHEGKIGMMWADLSEGTLGASSGIDPDLVGLASAPVGPTGKRGTELNAGMLGIFADIKPRGGYSSEEVRQAAFDFVWFYGSDEANRIRTEVLVEQGFGKFVNPLWLKKYGFEEYLKLSPPGWLEVFEDAVKNGKPEPYGKNCQMVYAYMTSPLEEVINLAFDDKLPTDETARRAKVQEILDEAVKRTNKEMIGMITPEERKKRNSVALVVGICMFAGFFLVLRKVWNIFTPKDEVGIKSRGSWQLWRYRWAYIILLPAIASVLLWNYYPMASGSVMAFQDYRVVGESKWVGLQNLADVLWDPVWWASLGRTLYYMALMLGFGFFTPIILAVLLSEVSHGKVIYRTIYYLPAVLSGIVVIYLWMLFFDPSDAGLLNMLLARIGIDKMKWLQDQKLAMLCCVIPSIWAGMGPGCLIYLAALKSVPDDLYEAADIDGCGFLQKVRHIMFPTIKGLVIIQFIGAFIGASQSAGFILVMTYGGPNDATKVAGLHIFDKAYVMLRFGTAITMAWLLGVVMLGFTVIQLKRLSRMEFTSAASRDAAKA